MYLGKHIVVHKASSQDKINVNVIFIIFIQLYATAKRTVFKYYSSRLSINQQLNRIKSTNKV